MWLFYQVSLNLASNWGKVKLEGKKQKMEPEAGVVREELLSGKILSKGEQQKKKKNMLNTVLVYQVA